MRESAICLALALSVPGLCLSAENVELYGGRDGAELVRQCSRPAPAPAARYWKPDAAIVARVEQAVADYMKTDRYRQRVSTESTRPALDQFVRQYTAYESDGRTMVYVNLLPWKFVERGPGKPVVVCDGGPQFWGVEFDVELDRIVGVEFNGII